MNERKIIQFEITEQDLRQLMMLCPAGQGFCPLTRRLMLEHPEIDLTAGFNDDID